MTDKNTVPQPPTRPIVGNIGELDSAAPIQSMMKLAKTYGPIYKLTIFGKDMYVVSSQELVNELSERYDPPGTYAAIGFVLLVSVLIFLALDRIERWLRP